MQEKGAETQTDQVLKSGWVRLVEMVVRVEPGNEYHPVQAVLIALRKKVPPQMGTHRFERALIDAAAGLSQRTRDQRPTQDVCFRILAWDGDQPPPQGAKRAAAPNPLTRWQALRLGWGFFVIAKRSGEEQAFGGAALERLPEHLIELYLYPEGFENPTED